MRMRCAAPAQSFPDVPCRQRGLCLLLAVRPEGVNHQWRKNPPGELSIDPVADERLVRVSAAGHRPGYCADKNRGFAVGMRNTALEKAYADAEAADVNAWQQKDHTDDQTADPEMAAAMQITDAKERAYAITDLMEQRAWQHR
jgi:hypothetical protein